MPQILIDKKKVTVSPGTKLIDAAEQVGIIIPRFCYHPALGSVGACRVCAVNITEGPVTGIKMSCRIDAEEGMVVSTTDNEAVDFRRHVIEWLMLNHPHDCPVCDEGGHCLLQDLTIAGGHGIRRFKGNKRTYQDQYLGPLVQHEMNRCIQCYRCSRFYQEFSGYKDFGVMGVASRIYFGRYQEGILKSPFCGNLIDICPTGVFTDKPSRYSGRHWDFERQPSICIHCSLGCSLTVSARYRQVVKQEARYHPDVNGHFICDRGRYGFYYANMEDRPRMGRVDQKRTATQKTIQIAAQRLEALGKKYDPSAVAVLSSTRCSLETLAGVAKLCRQKGWQEPYIALTQHRLKNVQTVLQHLSSGNALSLKDIEALDSILVVGADPINEAPMLTLALRQAVRNGAQVLCLDPRPLDLPFNYQHISASSKKISRILGALLSTDIGRSLKGISAQPGDIKDEVQSQLQSVARLFGGNQRTAIVCGTNIMDPRIIAQCAELTSRLPQRAGLFYTLPGPNAYGAALLDNKTRGMEDLLENMENGTIKAILLVETDPFWDFHNQARLAQAFKQVGLVVAMDYVRTQAMDVASIFIPTRTIYESGGIFINNEGRSQKAQPVFKGGIPIDITGQGKHPPREFRHTIPGDEVRSSGEILALLGQEEPGVSRQAVLKWLSDTYPTLAGVRNSREGIDGRVFSKPPFGNNEDKPRDRQQPPDESGFKILITEECFGTEILSSFSACLKQLEKEPYLCMNTNRADAMGLKNYKKVCITMGTVKIELDLKTSASVSEDSVIIPGLVYTRYPFAELCGKRIEKNQLSGVDYPS